MVRKIHTLLPFCLILVAFGAALVHAAEYDDVAVESKSPEGLVLRYTPGPLRWRTDEFGSHPDIVKTALREASGAPAVPGRIIYVALPPGTRVLNAELASVGQVEHGRNDAVATGSSELAFPFPSERVMIDEIFELRGLRIARLIVHPLLVESPDGDYAFTHDMQVQIRFEHAVPEPVSIPVVDRRRDPFGSILGNLLINPEQGLAWRQANATSRLAKVSETPDPFAGSDEWIALNNRSEGIVRVTGSQLAAAGVSLSGANPAQFRVFAGPGKQLSTQMSAPPPELTEIAIRVVDGGDGSFDTNDYLEYYAQSLNRWEFDDSGRQYDVVNRYARDNVYWLTLGGQFAESPRRVVVAPAPDPDPVPTMVFDARSRVRHEREDILRVNSIGYVNSYYTWYWRNRQSDNILMFAVDHVASGTTARIEVGAYNERGRGIHLLINGVEADTVLDPRTRVGEDGSRVITFRVPNFDKNATYTLQFDPSSRGEYYLDYYSVDYQRQLSLADGGIRFPTPDEDANLSVVLTDVITPEVWDITDVAAMTLYTGLVVNGNSAQIGVNQISGSRHILYAVEANTRVTPTGIRMVERSNLYHPLAAADYIAIGPRAFSGAMASFLSDRASTHGLATRYVPIEDIYDAFSFGIQDPVALRRFLRHTYLEWPSPAPAYALLVGDGSYDFLSNVGTVSVNYVPPYIVDDDQSVSDENYVYFGDKKVLNADTHTENDIFPDMLIGRWPVKTATDIQSIVAKEKEYESNDDLGPWRSRVAIVADDEFGDRSAGSVTEDFHVKDAEEIANLTIPPRMDLNKIYMTEYPFDNPGCKEPQAQGCRKPSVNKAILKALNDGVLVFDYIGHGNPDLLAHERVFLRGEELRELTNEKRATAVLTFSCSIGFFDDPRSEGMSEEWLRMPDVGAVAVVSATRLVTARANAALNLKVFDLLFNEDVTGIAAALYTAKLSRQYFATCSVCGQPPCPCENDRRYMLLGDPSLDLGLAQNRVAYTSIDPDTLGALAQVTVHGMVTDTTGTALTDFDGTVQIIVRDAPRPREYQINATRTLDYTLPGGTLYRGNVSVQSGAFEFGFVVPKDVAYGQDGARILAHASSADAMAAGASAPLHIAGAVGELSDTAGPAIELETAANESINDGFQIAAGTDIVVHMDDESGINLTGSPGHRLEVFLDGAIDPVADLTDAFAYASGVFTRGQAVFAFPDVSLGRHQLTVKAWDNANNSGALTVELDVTAPDAPIEFQVSEFLNYPNPFDDETTFYFLTTRSYRQAAIRIFTLAGRLIWERKNVVDGLTRWDGRDQDGDPVGNGVYLAQIEVTPDAPVVDKKAYREMKIVVSR